MTPTLLFQGFIDLLGRMAAPLIETDCKRMETAAKRVKTKTTAKKS
jgi:hypothetical protein